MMISPILPVRFNDPVPPALPPIVSGVERVFLVDPDTVKVAASPLMKTWLEVEVEVVPSYEAEMIWKLSTPEVGTEITPPPVPPSIAKLPVEASNLK